MKIILMMAMTADGIIARKTSELINWTSQADKKSFISETKKHRVVIMGRTTYETIGRPLPQRLNLILTSYPENYKDTEIPGILEFMNGPPKKVLEYLEKKGFSSAILAGGPKTNADFFASGLVDEILLTVEPKIFGNGFTFTRGKKFDIELELLGNTLLDKNILQIHYRVVKK